MKIIWVDGPDNAGKTTFIKELLQISDRYVLLDFPKRTTEGRLDIKSRNEVTIFETMLDYLDPNKIYILDRAYISNVVYGLLRREHKRVIDTYRDDIDNIFSKHNIFVVALTRNKIQCDFEDDLISLSADGFNKVIELFEFEYSLLEDQFNVYKLLDHSENNNLVGINHRAYSELVHDIIKWSK